MLWSGRRRENKIPRRPRLTLHIRKMLGSLGLEKRGFAGRHLQNIDLRTSTLTLVPLPYELRRPENVSR
jgi:hypothetical protein